MRSRCGAWEQNCPGGGRTNLDIGSQEEQEELENLEELKQGNLKNVCAGCGAVDPCFHNKPCYYVRKLYLSEDTAHQVRPA